MTLDEALDEMVGQIDLDGFAIEGVEPPPPGVATRFGFGWLYTVGLLEHFDHPELIMAGTDFKASQRLLASLGAAVIERDECFRPRETISLGSGPMGGIACVGHVHGDRLLDSTFATWHNLVDRGDLQVKRLQAVQILVPPSWPDDTHVGGQRDLSLASIPRVPQHDHGPTVVRMDRAARRRHARGRP